ncbi:restriction endonuclease subunit S [Aeromonas veronii]
MKAGWTINTLGNTCDMYQPKTISCKEMVQDGTYPVFGANGIIGRYDQYNHEEPQLLITCRGATCGSINISEPFSWITGNAMVIRPKQEGIDIRFLEYILRGGINISEAITGAAQPQITRTNLSPLKISYPTSLIEQQRIVAILDEAFEAIAVARANAEQNRQNARALFESYLQSVFSQRGDGWSEAKLSECFRLKSGDALTSKEMKSGEYPVYGGNGIAGTHDTFNLSGNNVIIGRVGALCGNARNIEESIWLTDNAFQVTDLKYDFDYAFLTYLLNFKNLRSLARQSAQPVISNSSLKDLLLNFPNITEQRNIVIQLDALSNKTQRLESLYQRKIAALDELKQSLLQQAFNGQL